MIDYTVWENHQQLKQLVQEKKVVGAKLSSPIYGMNQVRLFVSTDGYLCFFPKGAKRRGFWMHRYLHLIQELVYASDKPKKTQDEKTYAKIAKYRKMATGATYNHPFIDDCKNLPNSFDQWVADGKKDLYQYHITTGNRIEGKVITLDSFFKTYPREREAVTNAIANQTDYRVTRRRWRGYDCSMEFHKTNDHFLGTMALEYKGCGNGYYYILINDKNFIGYDID